MKKLLPLLSLILSIFVLVSIYSCVPKTRAVEVYEPYISRFEEEAYLIDLVSELKKSTVVVKHDKGHGSGVIYKKENISNSNEKLYYVLTNNHVITGGTNATVYFSSTEQYPIIDAAVIVSFDIAVVRFKTSKDFPVIEVKQINDAIGIELKVPQNLIVIGTPQDLNKFNYVTIGNLTLESYPYNGIKNLAFMTDTSINPGNSGGPVFNYNGDLIGLATAKIAFIPEPTGDIPAEGLGYCINLNYVGPYIKAFQEADFQAISRTPRLGVTIVNLSNFLESAVESGYDVSKVVPNVNGVVVVDLDPSRNAYGKIEIYDIITYCDGKPVTKIEDISSQLGTNPQYGDIHTLTVVRFVNGTPQTINYQIVLS